MGFYRYEKGVNRARVRAWTGRHCPHIGKRRFRMDKRVIIGVVAGLIVAVALFWAFTSLGGECGYAIRAMGGGIFDVIRECM